jgi:hypothetical protein
MGYLVLASTYSVGALTWSNPPIGAVDGFMVAPLDFATPVLS